MVEVLQVEASVRGEENPALGGAEREAIKADLTAPPAQVGEHAKKRTPELVGWLQNMRLPGKTPKKRCVKQDPKPGRVLRRRRVRAQRILHRKEKERMQPRRRENQSYPLNQQWAPKRT